MATLIDDLLSFSRMSRADLVQVETDLRSLAEAVVKDFEPETSQREVEINLGELPKAPCDAAMIRQVFANLIGNALKFTRNREKTIVEVGALSQEFDRVVVFVRDNGVGFDMTHAKKLFGVFQRLHSQDKFEGTGIGLANVRRIVRRHGGDTWAEGEIDKGATFFFSLPKKQAGSQAS
jgi:light-regulated signal transduction histidine kinase (bacteriophytochrome)